MTATAAATGPARRRRRRGGGDATVGDGTVPDGTVGGGPLGPVDGVDDMSLPVGTGAPARCWPQTSACAGPPARRCCASLRGRAWVGGHGPPVVPPSSICVGRAVRGRPRRPRRELRRPSGRRCPAAMSKRFA